MRILLLILAIFIMPINASADTKPEAMPGGLYKLDETHASLIWRVSHLGLSQYTARFTKFDADLMFDGQDVTKSKVRATIDPTSLKTDYPYPEEKDFDKKLIDGKQWFNVAQFPSITFQSTKIEKTGDTTGKMTGDLTFLGVTKPVTLDVTFNKALGNHPFQNKPALGFSATGSLKRSDFGMDAYIPNIGDEVEVILEVEFIHGG
jgi:polyisoprenoid-binding protein YceI